MYPKCYKSTSNVTKFLPEVKTFESSQQFHCNSKFMNMEYLPCSSKIPVQNIFWHKKFICYLIAKIFAAHFMTNIWLNIGKKIFYLIIYKQKNNPGECILRDQFQHISNDPLQLHAFLWIL